MVFRAKIINGQVVADQPIPLDDGTDVIIRLAPQAGPQDELPQSGDTVGQRLLKLAGIIDDPNMPTDGALKHDHYLYGTPKK